MPKGSYLLRGAALALLLAFGSTALAASPPAAPHPHTDDDDSLAAGADEIVGEVAVDLRDDLAPSSVAALEARYGLHPNSAYSPEHDRFETVTTTEANETAVIESLSREPGVENVERMEVFRASFVPDDPLYKDQWHLTRVGAETAWEYACGRGVTVAVVDTGVACFDKGPFSRGSDLAGTRCDGGYNFVSDKADAYDDQGHGTHVAGTVAQTTNNGKGTAGLAFCANLMPVKVLNRFGWGKLTDVAEGIRFAADHGAQVINLSLGGSSNSHILAEAVRYAQGKGALIIAAAGNSGKAVGYPAAYEGVVAVSATDTNDKVAWFSSRGPQIALAAPGVGVTQQTVCESGRNKCELFGTFSGTSMASPHVAGSAALLMAMGMTDPSAVRETLLGTARPSAAGAAAEQPSELYGAGIVNVAAAVHSVFVRRSVLRLGGLLGILWWIWQRIRRRRGRMAFTPGAMAGALFGSVGLVPLLPPLHVLPRLGSFRWLGELLARPFGEWDVGFSVGVHRWLPLANALPVLGAMALCFGVKRLRPALGGFAAGTVALLVQLAVSLDAATPLGPWSARLWLAANAAVCVWLARIALQTERAS
jgi:serine protease